MSSPLVVVVGAGGFGRETLDVLAAMTAAGVGPGYRLVGVLDDRPSAVNLDRLAAHGASYLGPVGDWLDGARSGRHGAVDYLIGVGDPSARRQLAGRFDDTGCHPAVAVHPAAVLGSASTLGPGVVVCAGVQVSTNVRLGAHVHLNPHATIGHDAQLADFVSVNPAATVSGECRIGAAALLGAGSMVLQGLAVGAGAVVGAAACVVRDVDPDVIVKGIPAR